MSYDDLKVIEVHHLVESIVTGTPRGGTIDDAVRAAQLIDALVRSAENQRWVSCT
jgi:predicted dehydrogenase